MCCIIHRPKGAKTIPDKNLESIIQINPHGWGLSYHKDGKLNIVRSLKMSSAIKAIRRLEKDDIEFLFHARWATHGDKSVNNCHPFKTHRGAIFHNGQIDLKCKNEKFSDTYHFAGIVSRMQKRGRKINFIFDLFKKALGYSRLAYVSNDGDVLKYGYWTQEDGCFYSKMNWKYEAYNRSHKRDVDDYASMWNNLLGGSKKESASPIIPRVDVFTQVLRNCAINAPLLQFQVGLLTEVELTTLSLNYPEACATYLLKQ